MTNLPHILEVAFLLLVAYLVGCVIGYLLRRVTFVAKPLAAAIPADRIAAATGGTPPLVVAPKVAPMASRPKPRPAVPAAPVASPEPVAVTEAAPALANAVPDPRAPASHPGEGWLGGPHVPHPPAQPENAIAAAVEPSAPIETEDLEAAAMRAIEGASSPAPRRPKRAPVPQAAPDPAPVPVVEIAAQAQAASPPLEIPIELPIEPPVERPAEPVPVAELAPTPQGGKVAIGFGRPEALAMPRAEGADNLRKIKGIDQGLESKLNELGIFHFDQIAAWDQKALVWMEGRLQAKGRITREKWLEQARALHKVRATALRK